MVGCDQHQPWGHLVFGSPPGSQPLLFFCAVGPNDPPFFFPRDHISFENRPPRGVGARSNVFGRGDGCGAHASAGKISSRMRVVLSLRYRVSRDSLGMFLANRGEAPPQWLVPIEGCCGVRKSNTISLCIISLSLSLPKKMVFVGLMYDIYSSVMRT